MTVIPAIIQVSKSQGRGSVVLQFAPTEQCLCRKIRERDQNDANSNIDGVIVNTSSADQLCGWTLPILTCTDPYYQETTNQFDLGGGFIHGGTSTAGWFLLGKIPSMDDGGHHHLG